MLKRLIVICLLFISCSENLETVATFLDRSGGNSNTDVQNKHDWKPATFKGIRTGISKREESLSILGQPVSSGEMKGKDVESDEIWDEYSTVNGYEGQVVVALSKSNLTILRILWYPTNLTLEDAKKIFGDDYKTTRYEFVPNCPKYEDTDGAPIYETPNGNLEYVEYRSQGVAISTEYTGKKVEYIQFVDKPIGFSSPQCE